MLVVALFFFFFLYHACCPYALYYVAFNINVTVFLRRQFVLCSHTQFLCTVCKFIKGHSPTHRLWKKRFTYQKDFSDYKIFGTDEIFLHVFSLIDLYFTTCRMCKTTLAKIFQAIIISFHSLHSGVVMVDVTSLAEVWSPQML